MIPRQRLYVLAVAKGCKRFAVLLPLTISTVVAGVPFSPSTPVSSDDVLRAIDGITSFPRPQPNLERLFAVGADSPVRGRGRVQIAADVLVDGVYRLPSIERVGSSRYVAIAMVTCYDGTSVTVQRAGDVAKVATQAKAYEDEDIQVCWLDQQPLARPLLDERNNPVRHSLWVILQRSSRWLNTPIYEIRLDNGQSLRFAVERRRSKSKRF